MPRVGSPKVARIAAGANLSVPAKIFVQITDDGTVFELDVFSITPVDPVENSFFEPANTVSTDSPAALRLEHRPRHGGRAVALGPAAHGLVQIGKRRHDKRKAEKKDGES